MSARTIALANYLQDQADRFHADPEDLVDAVVEAAEQRMKDGGKA